MKTEFERKGENHWWTLSLAVSLNLCSLASAAAVAASLAEASSRSASSWSSASSLPLKDFEKENGVRWGRRWDDLINSWEEGGKEKRRKGEMWNKWRGKEVYIHQSRFRLSGEAKREYAARSFDAVGLGQALKTVGAPSLTLRLLKRAKQVSKKISKRLARKILETRWKKGNTP